MERLIRANQKYAERFVKKGLEAPPAKPIAVIACMDARLETGALLGLEEGDCHVIRNAGGVVTDDVIRSLAISQLLLGTDQIMVIHHTDCGMSKFGEDELRRKVQEATGQEPPFPMHTFSDLESDVRASLERLRESPFLLHRNRIRGFVYDVESGRLREVA